MPVTQQGEDKARGRAEPPRGRTERREAGHRAEDMRHRWPVQGQDRTLGASPSRWGQSVTFAMGLGTPYRVEGEKATLYVSSAREETVVLQKSSNHREQEEGRNEVPGFV